MSELGMMGAGAGFQLGADMINSAIGFGRNRRAQKRAFKMQKKLNQQNHDLNFSMWEKTSFPAQVKKLMEAGLNPALMYAKGGNPGSTGSQGGSAPGGGGSASVPTMDINSMQVMAQNKLLNAQKENIEADTALKKKDTEKRGTEILDLVQGIENKVVQAELTRVQIKYQNIVNDISEATKKDEIALKSNMVKSYIEQIKGLNLDNELKSGTLANNIAKAGYEMIQVQLQNVLTAKMTDKTEAEIEKISADITRDLETLAQNSDKISVAEMETYLKVNYPSIMNVFGANLNNILEGAEDLGAWMKGKLYRTPSINDYNPSLTRKRKR